MGAPHLMVRPSCWLLASFLVHQLAILSTVQGATTTAATTTTSWNFHGVTSVQQAAALANGNPFLASLNLKGALSTTQVDQLSTTFDNWAAYYQYTFTPLQRIDALANFKNNLMTVYNVNSNVNTSWWASGNKWSHLSSEQFVQQILMKNNPSSTFKIRKNNTGITTGPHRRLSALPASVNWVTQGKTTAVKDQAQCGSCWAFASTAAIESAYLMMNPGVSPASIHLSEQQLTSCCTGGTAGCRYSGGCNGGLADEAINYVYSNFGQTTFARYPYNSGSGVTSACNNAIVSSTQAGQNVQLGAQAIMVSPANSESALMAAVAIQPTVIYFDVENSFQNYAGGIYSGSDCGANTNHAMVAEGYSVSGTTKYWLIRNSWSASWGENGYIRVKMTGDGIGPCGMYQESYRPPLSFKKGLSGGTPIPSPSPGPSPAAGCNCAVTFVYNGVTYNSCTQVDSPGYPWCVVTSTCTSPDGKLSSSGLPWKYCGAKPPPTASPSPKPSPLPSPKLSPVPSPKLSPVPSPKLSPVPSPVPSPKPSPSATCSCRPTYVYLGKTYSGCINIDSGGHYWCGVTDACTSYDGLDPYSTPPYLPWKWCGSGVLSPTPTPTPSPAPSPTSAVPAGNGCTCMSSYVYRGVTYRGCITVDSNAANPWCMVTSTCAFYDGLDPNSTPQYEKWKFCTATTTGSAPRQAPPTSPNEGKCPCMFPFTYRNSAGVKKTYTSCTTVDSPNKPWCVADLSGGNDYDYDYDYYDYAGNCRVDGQLTSLTSPNSSVAFVYC